MDARDRFTSSWFRLEMPIAAGSTLSDGAFVSCIKYTHCTPDLSLRCEDDGVKAVLFFDAMIVLLCLAAPSPPPPRAIHYVIRVSELEEVLEFTDKVLGMKVLRHEENEAASVSKRPTSSLKTLLALLSSSQQSVRSV